MSMTPKKARVIIFLNFLMQFQTLFSKVCFFTKISIFKA